MTACLVFFPFAVCSFGAEKASVNPAATEEAAVQQQSVILSGDRLSVRLAEDPAYGGIFSVSENGLLILPLLNEVTAAGLTSEALAKKIKEKLEKEYYRQATIRVTVYERNPRLLPYERGEGESGLYQERATEVIGEIWVWGQVARPGAVPIIRGKKLTVIKAILTCGGFSDFAKRNKVQVIRTNEKGEQKTILVNVAEIMKKGLLKKDLELKDGDVVNVPQSFFNF